LYGNVPTSTTWLAVAGITVVGWLITLMVFARYRTRIPYWV
jgi:ABC-type polysaccharide/polyol phosphate export permease